MRTQDSVAIWACIICSNIQTISDAKYSGITAAVWLLLAVAIGITAKIYSNKEEAK